jgi:CheY-like chemotaxis protein
MAESGTLILVCDDECAIADAVSDFLRLKGYDVITAHTGTEAIALSQQHAGRVQLVIMDVMMPDALGPTVVEELLQLNPAMRVLYLSGHAQDESMYSGPARLPMAMLRKPCSLVALWKVVQDLLAFRDVVSI